MTTIHKGDTIVFKPEWQDKGDSKRVFIAVEDQAGGRLAVQDSTHPGPFKPWSRIDVNMIATVNGEPLCVS